MMKALSLGGSVLRQCGAEGGELRDGAAPQRDTLRGHAGEGVSRGAPDAPPDPHLSMVTPAGVVGTL